MPVQSTDRAALVMALAESEARRLHAPSVRLEHLLLALVAEPSGAGGAVLRSFGIAAGPLRHRIEAVATTDRVPVGAGTCMPSGGLRHAKSFAASEVEAAGWTHLDTEHLTLGLVREAIGLAFDILREFGVTEQLVRRRLEARAARDHAGAPAGGAAGIELSAAAAEIVRTSAHYARLRESDALRPIDVIRAISDGPDGIARRAIQPFAPPLAAGSATIAAIESLLRRRRPPRGLSGDLLSEATRLAREYHSPTVTSGHLLLALFSLCAPETSRALMELDRSPADVRRRTIDGFEHLDEPTRTAEASACSRYADGPCVAAAPRLDAAPHVLHGVGAACPQCGRDNRRIARYCRHCGSALPGVTRRAAAIRPTFDEWLERGISLRRRGAAILALKPLHEAHRLASAAPQPMLEIARCQVALGRPGVAWRWYRGVVDRESGCLAAWMEGLECLGRRPSLRRARWLDQAVRAAAGRALRPQLVDCVRGLNRWQRLLWAVTGRNAAHDDRP